MAKAREDAANTLSQILKRLESGELVASGAKGKRLMRVKCFRENI